MKINYVDWNPRGDSQHYITMANDILEDYKDQDLTLSLRQLYYQMVSKNIIENTERSYKNLGSLITKARNAGLVSWLGIEDRNREHKDYWYGEDVTSEIDNLPFGIQFDQWKRQENYIEVWVEKEALGNIIEKACRPLLVPYMSCKGYLSASEAWRAGRRFKRKANEGKKCTVIHLGDHDPSGMDMTRDNQDRLHLYGEFCGVEVKRIALNMDQIEEYDPPPNPAKTTDSRSIGYIDKFGESSWELDALEPTVMIDLIKDTIEPMIDRDVWNSVKTEENNTKEILHSLSDNWNDVVDFLSNLEQ